MLIKPINGWNRVTPVHELTVSKDGGIQCSVLQNYVTRDNKIKKIGGTVAYNSTALTNNIPWVKRSYHKLGDGTFVSRTLLYSGNDIYSGDDASGTLTSTESGISDNVIPMDMTMQVAGQSILYFFTGSDAPKKYDGNNAFSFETTALSTAYESATIHLQRAWYIPKNSSSIPYSETLNPETIEDEIIFGNDRNSVARRLVRGFNENFYLFKNDSIWQLFGRTPTQFQARVVTTKYGLAAKRAIYPVGGGFVFWNEYDKELYFFGGTEASIRPLTERDIRLRDIIDVTPDEVAKGTMTVHDGLFRFAFKHRESPIDEIDSELIYAIAEPLHNGYPKWSLIRGTNVASYSVWDQQGDNQQLLTGRSDEGLMMYHNQGHDFDGNAVETIVRTGEVVADEEFVVRFKGFYIKAKPGSANIKAVFRYYLNGRFSDRGEADQSMKGETRQVGEIYFQKSSLLNDRIIPLSNYSRGNSISFELRDNNNGTDMELYSFAFQAQKRYKIRNQYI